MVTQVIRVLHIQVRIKPKSYKTYKFENHIIHPKLSLVLPVLRLVLRG